MAGPLERLQRKVEERVTEKAMRRLQPAIDEMAKLRKEIVVLVSQVDRLNKNFERFFREAKK